MAGSNLFERHPKATICVLLLLVYLVIDFSLGYFLCPKIVGEPDAFFHHGLPTSYSGQKEWGGQQHPFHTNALGFKDRAAVEVPRDAGRRRIVVIGDSFTEGVGVPHEETFSGILQSRLGAQGIDVLNAGVLSYSPKLYYLKTKYLLRNLNLKFDELIVFLDMSDIQDEVRYEAFTPSEDFGISSSYLITAADSFLRQHSLSYLALRKAVSRLLGDREATEVPAEDLMIQDQEFLDNWSVHRIMWAFDEEIFQRWGAKGLRLAKEHMALLAELCRQNGIELTVAVYPWPRQIMAADLESKQVRIWEDFCDEHKIGFLNLFPAFIDGREPLEVLQENFIPGDVHWNAGGHRLVAERLLEFQQAQGGAR